MTTHFFLGANSGQGFQNLFPHFCKPEDHYDLIVLKGGPGVGKSTMMRRVGKAMEDRGEDVEYLYCSGDPNSLDGVHIPRIRTAIVDGTAPHGSVTAGHKKIPVWKVRISIQGSFLLWADNGPYAPNSSAACFMFSTAFTPKGQRFSHAPQAAHSPALWGRAA